MTPVLVSVNVGLPKNVPWQGKTVYTGVWKHPVPGPAMVRRLNVDGDGQGDLAGHGVTPVLAMLGQLAAARSDRDLWWIYGARGPSEHPLAAEAHALLARLPRAHEHVFYSTIARRQEPAAASPD